MVDMKMGSEAFFEPLTVTSPVSFLPPLMINLSNVNLFVDVSRRRMRAL